MQGPAVTFLHHHSSPQQDCIRGEYVIFIKLISHGNFTCLTSTVWEELFSDVQKGDRRVGGGERGLWGWRGALK